MGNAQSEAEKPQPISGKYVYETSEERITLLKETTKLPVYFITAMVKLHEVSGHQLTSVKFHYFSLWIYNIK